MTLEVNSPTIRHSSRRVLLALFYTFATEQGHRISLTPEHLVYVGNQTYVQARYVDAERHHLYFLGQHDRLEASRIRSIDIEFKRGYATPITQHGTLLVNRISSSCYSSIYYHQLGHLAMAPLRWLHQARQLFGLDNKRVSLKSNGIHWYPRTLNNFVHLFGPLSHVFTSTMGTI